MHNNKWIKRDLNTIWHPCSQMSDYEIFPPLLIKKAKKSFLYLNNGKKVIDANSSWWCKSLGHGHPLIKKSLKKQLQSYEHIIGANTVQKPLVELSEKLLSLNPSFSKVFYASEGSTAIEIALKMAIHAQQRKGQANRTHFIALEHSYHGETALALSVSHLNLYKKPYAPLMPNKVHFLSGLPYIQDMENPIKIEPYWKVILAQLEDQKEISAAIILEPILQGAGGMKIYHPLILNLICDWAKKNGVYIIFDEIMTGFWRTGRWFSHQYSNVNADFLCLSKGLTAGTLPLSCVLMTQSLYSLFYGKFGAESSFLHSNTYCGNALATSVANQVLKIYEKKSTQQIIQENSKNLKILFNQMATASGKIKNIRQIGMMVAGDLIISKEQSNQRVGFEIFKIACQKGALLRPLGNTIYWMPPLNTEKKVLTQLADISFESIKQFFDNSVDF